MCLLFQRIARRLHAPYTKFSRWCSNDDKSAHSDIRHIYTIYIQEPVYLRLAISRRRPSLCCGVSLDYLSSLTPFCSQPVIFLFALLLPLYTYIPYTNRAAVGSWKSASFYTRVYTQKLAFFAADTRRAKPAHDSYPDYKHRFAPSLMHYSVERKWRERAFKRDWRAMIKVPCNKACARFCFPLRTIDCFLSIYIYVTPLGLPRAFVRCLWQVLQR